MKLHDIIGTVNVFAIFEENNTAYLVMEYLDGCTLAQMLKKKDNAGRGSVKDDTPSHSFFAGNS